MKDWIADGAIFIWLAWGAVGLAREILLLANAIRLRNEARRDGGEKP